MKPLILALGLFVAFLLVRNTFTMSAQGRTSDKPRAVALSVSDTRVRRVAALEFQEQSLAQRQQQLEAELEQTRELLQKVENHLERLNADNDEDQQTLLELAPIRTQVQQKKKDAQLELDKLLLERRRVHEEWTAVTGLQTVQR